MSGIQLRRKDPEIWRSRSRGFAGGLSKYSILTISLLLKTPVVAISRVVLAFERSF